MASRIQLVQCHSNNILLAHIVWATARRAPVLEASADAWLAQVLRRKAHDAGSLLVACGNAADHVHVLVRYPSTVTVASVVQRLKGASSYEWNHAPRSPRLSWQTGLWSASVSGSAQALADARQVRGQGELAQLQTDALAAAVDSALKGASPALEAATR